MIYNTQYTYEIKKVVSGLPDAASFGAFPIDTVLTLKFIISRKAAVSDVTLMIYNDDTYTNTEQQLNFDGIENGSDVYTTDLQLNELALMFCKIRYNTNYTEEFQLSVYDKNYTSPNWIKGGGIYQIFVDRFAKSDRNIKPKKDTVPYNDVPIYAEKPGDPIDNNDFYGGDLYGAADKLDYIKSLGCNCVYLNPIFEAHSNHKYDTGDYNKIDSMFGGDTAFDYFIAEAEKRDIHVILDGVFNHTGADSRYFNKFGTYSTKGAYQSKRSPYYQWYKFKSYPDDYDCWWGVDILPAVDDSNKSYREFMCGENGIIRKYIRKGISGWRLDVADELSEDFIEDINQAAKAENPDAFIIGEVWEDASNKIAYDKRRHYLRGGQLDSVMNYPLRNAVINFIKYGDSETLYKTSAEIYEHYPKHVCDSLMNILGTHDTERIISLLGSDKHIDKTNAELAVLTLTDDEYKTAVDKVKLAYLICATMYGVPCIYYGDEAGMEGYRDPFNRRVYLWENEETALIHWYKQIGQLRINNSEFADGLFKPLYNGDGVIVYERNHTVIAVNVSDCDFTWKTFTVPPMSGIVVKNGAIILNSACV
jgi:Glycosidases